MKSFVPRCKSIFDSEPADVPVLTIELLLEKANLLRKVQPARFKLICPFCRLVDVNNQHIVDHINSGNYE